MVVLGELLDATGQGVCRAQGQMSQALDLPHYCHLSVPLPPAPYKGSHTAVLPSRSYHETLLVESLARWLALRKCSAFIVV